MALLEVKNVRKIYTARFGGNQVVKKERQEILPFLNIILFIKHFL